MVQNFLITKSSSIKNAMKQMNKIGEKALFIVDENRRLLGSLTDGDIRRWILKKGGLDEKIDRAYRKNPIFVTVDYDVEEVKQLMLDNKVEWIPVINGQREVIEVLLWQNIFGEAAVCLRPKLFLPVVIMAGGKGARLDPFTKILPKALIPIGERPIIKIIMDNFFEYGIEEFYVSINHKSKMIKSYFEEMNSNYTIHFIEEKFPLGTAGSLKFLQGITKDSLLVTNCDIIVKADLSEIVEFHNKNAYDMTIVGSFKHHTVPYGICEIENGGILKVLNEKPEYDFIVNTGMYVIKDSVLDLIPEDQIFHITDLIKHLKVNRGRVGVFPISERSWIDVGQWKEYHRAVRELNID